MTHKYTKQKSYIHEPYFLFNIANEKELFSKKIIDFS